MRILPNDSVIGVMSVATNHYLEYWKDLVLSADRVTKYSDQVVFYVFTEETSGISLFADQLKNVHVKAFEIPAYGWPEATLLRYEIFEKNLEDLKADFLVHLDADTLLVANPWDRIKKNLTQHDVCLVEHPGFWRPNFSRRIQFYIKNPHQLLVDVFLRLRHGGRGTWEVNKYSEAHVKRSLRETYFCGGVWFGTKAAIGHLLETLAKRVRTDLDNDVIAKWHDESHLNKWAIDNFHASDNPELCFDETYIHLSALDPFIVAVRKENQLRK